MQTKALRADVLMLITAMIWGSGFVAQTSGMDHIGPFLYSGLRFAIGSLCLLPLVLWLFDTSVSSEISFGRFKAAFESGLGFVPGWFLKLVVLGLIWGYLHHMIAGMRHLWMDISHDAVTKQFGKSSAIFTLIVSIGLTVVLGAKLFGLY